MLLRSAQCAFFTRLDLADKLRVGSVLRGALQGILDGEPLVLPSFPDAPAEVPQVILRSKDQSRECTVSSARVDFHYRAPDPQGVTQDHIERHLENAKRLHSAICQDLGGRVIRVGLLTQFELRLDEEAALFIRDRFLKPEAPPGKRGVQLSTLGRETWNDIEVNTWVRVRGEHARDDPAAAYVLRVASDINSVPEQEYDFDPPTLERFYTRSSRFLAEDLPRLVGVQQ